MPWAHLWNHGARKFESSGMESPAALTCSPRLLRKRRSGQFPASRKILHLVQHPALDLLTLRHSFRASQLIPWESRLNLFDPFLRPLVLDISH